MAAVIIDLDQFVDNVLHAGFKIGELKGEKCADDQGRQADRFFHRSEQVVIKQRLGFAHLDAQRADDESRQQPAEH